MQFIQTYDSKSIKHQMLLVLLILFCRPFISHIN